MLVQSNDRHDTVADFDPQTGQLTLVDSCRFDLQETTVKWCRKRKTSVFAIEDRSGKYVLKYEVRIPGPPLSQDPTPFIDEEDWDFGLFISNVMSVPERRELVALLES